MGVRNVGLNPFASLKERLLPGSGYAPKNPHAIHLNPKTDNDPFVVRRIPSAQNWIEGMENTVYWSHGAIRTELVSHHPKYNKIKYLNLALLLGCNQYNLFVSGISSSLL